MSTRNCPKGGRWLGRGRSIFAAARVMPGLLLAFPLAVQAQADKGVIGDRVDRIRGAQAQQAAQQQADAALWSPAKIMVNLDARCPVITALGYFGALATADQDSAKAAEMQSRYAQLQKTAQPIADELKKLAANTTFVGQKFPESLVPRLDGLSGQLFAQVLKLYGDAGLADLKLYLAAQSQGVVVK